MDTPIKSLAFLLFLTAFTSQAIADSKFSYSLNGKQYGFTITRARQAKCPQWNPEKDDHPPYPAAKALAHAKAFIKTVPTLPDTSWEMDGLALVQVSGSWAWRAHYNLRSRGASIGIQPTMDC